MRLQATCVSSSLPWKQPKIFQKMCCAAFACAISISDLRRWLRGVTRCCARAHRPGWRAPARATALVSRVADFRLKCRHRLAISFESAAQMKLPNTDNLVVEREKILDYLLNPRHRLGGSKARFFDRFGFTPEHWQQLAEALRIHGQTHEVRRSRQTGFGPRFEVEGRINAPDGRSPNVRTVWQHDHGAVAPRLITAYPLEEL